MHKVLILNITSNWTYEEFKLSKLEYNYQKKKKKKSKDVMELELPRVILLYLLFERQTKQSMTGSY